MTLTREAVVARAKALGFVDCGIADLGPNPHADELDRWLAAGYGGTMRYLHRQAAKRKRPERIEPGAIRAVVVLDNYYPGPTADAEDRFRIAKYALGRDYHLTVGERLERLAAYLRQGGAGVARPFVDAGPVPERELARRAGLGWIGKNTMLLRPGDGSFFVIGSVLTDLPLDPSPPFETDHCGTCTRCLDACPTNAFPAPRVLDATRCISFLTIEWKGELPAELVPRFDGWAFGCDICNDVCPWNERFARPTAIADYRDRHDPDRHDPAAFDDLNEAEFAIRFGDTPLERPGLERMRRNVRAAVASLTDPLPPNFGSEP